MEGSYEEQKEILESLENELKSLNNELKTRISVISLFKTFLINRFIFS